MLRTFFSLLLVAIQLVHGGSAPAAFAFPAVIDAAASRELAGLRLSDTLDVIITLRGQADFSRLERSSVPLVLQEYAAAAQADVLAALRAMPADQVHSITPLWINNTIALSASRRVILDLAQRSDVARIQLDEVVETAQRSAAPLEPAANLVAIGAPTIWQRGIMGQGVVVAVLDSGADLSHADLKAKWRGGSNSWFDPYGEHDTPVDLTGHGTQVLGVILGGESDGGLIGVAPGAQWIAARIFNDRGRATHSAIHRALQWVLDPDGDPATHDMPQVVNNSWSAANPGCDSDFADDLRALRAAGILPVFAAGVNLPIGPANTREAFAVGALDDNGALLADSARGPSDCLAANAVYPQIVAPGSNIHTTDHYGAFTDSSGTSLAAAHVSGALALLLSAKPQLSADEQADMLTRTASDLGEHGPDNAFGYGRLDVVALIDRAVPTNASPWPALLAGTGLLLVGGAVIIVWRRRSHTAQATTTQRMAINMHGQDLDS